MLLSGSRQVRIAGNWYDVVRDVIAFEKSREYPAGTESVWFKGYQEEDRRRLSMASALKVGVEVRNEGARKIHARRYSELYGIEGYV